jgi:hypothetical protein
LDHGVTGKPGITPPRTDEEISMKVLAAAVMSLSLLDQVGARRAGPAP